MSLLAENLVPVVIEYHDERGWTNQESASSDRARYTWPVVAGQSYIRAQNVNGLLKIFPAKVIEASKDAQNNPGVPFNIDIQSNVAKDDTGNFPSIFYYKAV